VSCQVEAEPMVKWTERLSRDTFRWDKVTSVGQVILPTLVESMTKGDKGISTCRFTVAVLLTP
jgi:hypothetical protein